MPARPAVELVTPYATGFATEGEEDGCHCHHQQIGHEPAYHWPRPCCNRLSQARVVRRPGIRRERGRNRRSVATCSATTAQRTVASPVYAFHWRSNLRVRALISVPSATAPCRNRHTADRPSAPRCGGTAPLSPRYASTRIGEASERGGARLGLGWQNPQGQEVELCIVRIIV